MKAFSSYFFYAIKTIRDRDPIEGVDAIWAEHKRGYLKLLGSLLYNKAAP
ncbi:hypothetical protein [Parabacteroides sp. Marseille-P3160]|nr:hypothetical protein [Parabacteroides sp. Marseille-P3160]